MKIARFYERDRIHLGVIENESLMPIDFHGEMIDFIQRKPSLKTSGKAIAVDKVKFAPSINNPSKIIALGLNYMDHIKESKGKPPESPLIFAKFPSTLTGHNDYITWDPSLTKKVDFEAELAVIIGNKIYNCPKDRAMEAIFGYTCADDVSARDLQFGDGQWVRGKSLDTFCPLGPWIVTADDVPDPHCLDIRCWLNGQIMQDSNTSMMIFRIPDIISFISKYFTLIPGDIIITGTPHGVGTFRDPPIYMKDGDEVVVEIEKIGRLVNRCRTGFNF